MVANASKTALVVFRRIDPQREPFRINLSGETIKETTDEKLLGIYIQSDLKWEKQIDRVISEANYAISLLMRLRDHLDKKELRMIADGLVMSKIRYWACRSMPQSHSFFGKSIRKPLGPIQTTAR